MSQEFELQIQEAGADVAPRITKEHIDSLIVREHYFMASEAAGLSPVGGLDHIPPRPASPLDLLTFCVLELKNGFTVTGESACVSPTNFDDVIGRQIARRNAYDKIWLLEGYLLKEQLSK